MTKNELRKRYLDKRMSLSLEEVRKWSEKIAEHVLSFVEEQNVQTVFLYAAFQNEPETESLIKKLLVLGKNVALPRCEKYGRMTMLRVTDISSLSPGAYGILEPKETEAVLPEAADLVLIPGCVFGRDMTRLGYGGGYYDRYLPLCTKAIKAGLCYEISLKDTLPTENFDVKMDCIITEKGLMNNL